MTVTITFPEPADRLMSNDRPHWSRRARLTRIWRTASALHAHRTLGPGRASRAQPPSFVRVTFPVTVNRRRDSDGPAPTVKAIVDGLVDAGCWPDDTPEWVETLGSRFDKGATVVVVELTPMGEAAACAACAAVRGDPRYATYQGSRCGQHFGVPNDRGRQ